MRILLLFLALTLNPAYAGEHGGTLNSRSMEALLLVKSMVNLSNISVFAYPSQPDLVVVNFEQDYASNNLNNRMKKRQYWMKRDNRWQIVYEGAA